jgi:hypothetical protein
MVLRDVASDTGAGRGLELADLAPGPKHGVEPRDQPRQRLGLRSIFRRRRVIGSHAVRQVVDAGSGYRRRLVGWLRLLALFRLVLIDLAIRGVSQSAAHIDAVRSRVLPNRIQAARAARQLSRDVASGPTFARLQYFLFIRTAT